MVYLDTSVLLPLFVREPQSEPVRAWLQALSQGDPTISEWTRTEFASAVGIMVRSRRLEEEIARAALRAFNEMIDNSLGLLIPEKKDFLLACRFLDDSSWDSGLETPYISLLPPTMARGRLSRSTAY